MRKINDRSRDIGEYKPGIDDDMIICRCEEITKGEIRRAVHDGMFTITEIRRYLRTSMGLCSGSDLWQAGKGYCGKRIRCFPFSFRTSHVPCPYETHRNESSWK